MKKLLPQLLLALLICGCQLKGKDEEKKEKEPVDFHSAHNFHKNTPLESTGSKVAVKKEDVKIEPLEGGISIYELFANKEKYEGEKVLIKGKVTKYNAGIMNKNWLHLQDGSEYEGKFDLVATSKLEFKLGEIVTIEGKVALNKDFGHGYKYEVIIEGIEKK